MKNHQGQGLVEYLILLCLIAVSAIAVVSTVGKNLKEQYANISKAISGKEKIQLTDVKENTYRVRGMDDYMESSKKSE